MMTSLTVPLPYPLAAEDEQRAVDRTAVMVATVRDRLSREFSREWLETELRNGLREGRLRLCALAVEAADRGDEIAEGALREVGAELQTLVLQRQTLAPGHLQVAAYVQRVLQRPPLKRQRGHAWHDDWVHNINISVLVAVACAEFGVAPTRNRQSRRSGQRPSGISIVTAALARNGIHIDEASIQRNIWFGLPGELVRQIMAGRLP